MSIFVMVFSAASFSVRRRPYLSLGTLICQSGMPIALLQSRIVDGLTLGSWLRAFPFPRAPHCGPGLQGDTWCTLDDGGGMASQGGHLNPAVTFAFLITKQICLMRAVLYWIAQIVGSILGSACVFAVSCADWDTMWHYGWEPRQHV